MSSFKFNFSGINEEPQPDEEKKNVCWIESAQVMPNQDLITKFDDIVTHAKMFTSGDVEIGHVLLDKSITSLDTEESDLVPGKYEGGLKIWECTYDLIEYLTDNKELINLANKKVLDLGCGAGILGIFALLNGSTVTFQDYNREVIEKITIPNVLLNIDDVKRDCEISKCKFYCGDWASFSTYLSELELFDIILSCETIYNIQNYEKLINIVTKHLNKNGTAYVAAKSYYFGVGGGTRQFEIEVEKTAKLKSEVIWKSSGGIQREILKINHIKSSMHFIQKSSNIFITISRVRNISKHD